MAAKDAAANINESPGKNGVTTNPVSQKIITNKITYVNTPYSFITFPKVFI